MTSQERRIVDLHTGARYRMIGAGVLGALSLAILFSSMGSILQAGVAGVLMVVAAVLAAASRASIVQARTLASGKARVHVTPPKPAPSQAVDSNNQGLGAYIVLLVLILGVMVMGMMHLTTTISKMHEAQQQQVGAPDEGVAR